MGGCVYPFLRRLEAEGLLEGWREVVGGRCLVIHRMTDSGHLERIAMGSPTKSR